MKNLKLILLAISFVVFSGCKVDDLIPGLGASMTAKVDGSSFNAVGVAATRTPAAGPLAEGFTVGGNEGTSYPAITLTVYTTTTGTYTLGLTAPNSPIAVYAATAANQGVAISGSITITSIDYSLNGKVEGTFAFETGTYSITEGSFEANFVN